MTTPSNVRPRRAARVPPLLVGVATAVAAEVSIAMLLYGAPGFARSLTTMLVVQALALGAGLGTRGAEPGQGLRRRWLFSLTAYVVAAGFSALWTVFPAVGDGRLGQGLGLAALAALPLYACGSLLAGLSVDAASSRRGEGGAADEGGPAIASTAAFGAALGFVGTGLLLPRAPMPASLLVVCVVLLSLGGMIHSAEVAEREPSDAEGQEGSEGSEMKGPESTGALGQESPEAGGQESAEARDPESLEARGPGSPEARRPGSREIEPAGPTLPMDAGFRPAGEDPPTS